MIRTNSGRIPALRPLHRLPPRGRDLIRPHPRRAPLINHALHVGQRIRHQANLPCQQTHPSARPFHGSANLARRSNAPELRTAIAELLAPIWPGVDPEDLVVVSGATAALDILASTLCDPGEAIVAPAPYYAAFDTDLTGRSGARLVPAPMSPASGFALDPVAVDRALTAARRDGAVVRALAVTSPSNPVGQVYSAAVLRDLVAVATAHSVDVIADEIFAHSVFGARFVSMVGERAVHGIWGFGKDFGLSGFKVGVLHTRDPQVRAGARALAYFAPVSTHTQALLTNLLRDAAWSAEFLAENRRRLRASAIATMDLLNCQSRGSRRRCAAGRPRPPAPGRRRRLGRPSQGRMNVPVWT